MLCCEDNNQPYLGVDQQCQKLAVFCLKHSPHLGNDGLFHEMLPLKLFKRHLLEKKFKMIEKVRSITQDYCSIMQKIIQQLKQLKIKKSTQLSMLWLRELAQDQQEFQEMKSLYRMEFDQFTCSQIHRLYFKIIKNNFIQQQKLQDIPTYKGVLESLGKLKDQNGVSKLLATKISQIDGILSDGHLLAKALPQIYQQERVEEVVLEGSGYSDMEVICNEAKKIGAATATGNSAIYSKYSLVTGCNYYLSLKSQYMTVLLGISSKNALLSEDIQHHKKSILLNLSNGCIYKNGNIQNSVLPVELQNMKQVTLKIKIIQDSLLILLDKQYISKIDISSLLKGTEDQIGSGLHLTVFLKSIGDQVKIFKEPGSYSELVVKQVEEQEYRLKEQIEDETSQIQKSFTQISEKSDKVVPTFQEIARNRNQKGYNITHATPHWFSKQNSKKRNYAQEVLKKYQKKQRKDTQSKIDYLKNKQKERMKQIQNNNNSKQDFKGFTFKRFQNFKQTPQFSEGYSSKHSLFQKDQQKDTNVNRKSEPIEGLKITPARVDSVKEKDNQYNLNPKFASSELEGKKRKESETIELKLLRIEESEIKRNLDSSFGSSQVSIFHQKQILTQDHNVSPKDINKNEREQSNQNQQRKIERKSSLKSKSSLNKIQNDIKFVTIEEEEIQQNFPQKSKNTDQTPQKPPKLSEISISPSPQKKKDQFDIRMPPEIKKKVSQLDDILVFQSLGAKNTASQESKNIATEFKFASQKSVKNKIDKKESSEVNIDIIDSDQEVSMQI